MLQDLLKGRKPIYETITESIVWDDNWIHWLDQPGATRALYVGDSISRGVRVIANGMFGTKLFFDTFSTSKSLDNPYFFPTLKMFAEQQPHREAVLFNNGLHGWHLSEEEYGELYAAFVDDLIAEYGREKIYLVLTTYSASEHYPNDRVIARNEIALRIAEEKNLKVIDLYTVSVANKEHLVDGVHFDNEGYTALANALADAIKELW